MSGNLSFLSTVGRIGILVNPALRLFFVSLNFPSFKFHVWFVGKLYADNKFCDNEVSLGFKLKAMMIFHVVILSLFIFGPLAEWIMPLFATKRYFLASGFVVWIASLISWWPTNWSWIFDRNFSSFESLEQ